MGLDLAVRTRPNGRAFPALTRDLGALQLGRLAVCQSYASRFLQWGTITLTLTALRMRVLRAVTFTTHLPVQLSHFCRETHRTRSPNNPASSTLCSGVHTDQVLFTNDSSSLRIVQRSLASLSAKDLRFVLLIDMLMLSFKAAKQSHGCQICTTSSRLRPGRVSDVALYRITF
jgi:hypothetical protein